MRVMGAFMSSLKCSVVRDSILVQGGPSVSDGLPRTVNLPCYPEGSYLDARWHKVIRRQSIRSLEGLSGSCIRSRIVAEMKLRLSKSLTTPLLNLNLSFK